MTDALSPHFRLREFDCKDGTPAPAGARAALELWCFLWGEPLREEFGRVRILSGYRTERWNRLQGGAASSYHVYDAIDLPWRRLRHESGVAADVVCQRGNAQRWHEWARMHRRESRRLGGIRRGGVGFYPAQRFVHLDTGPERSWQG